jgi:hypothetical protein
VDQGGELSWSIPSLVYECDPLARPGEGDEGRDEEGLRYFRLVLYSKSINFMIYSHIRSRDPGLRPSRTAAGCMLQCYSWAGRSNRRLRSTKYTHNVYSTYITAAYAVSGGEWCDPEGGHQPQLCAISVILWSISNVIHQRVERPLGLMCQEQ